MKRSYCNRYSLEPITGMDMPFSSLAAGASVVRVSSNTGGLGGVILHRHVEKQAGQHIQHIRITSVKAALSTTKCDRGKKNPNPYI